MCEREREREMRSERDEARDAREETRDAREVPQYSKCVAYHVSFIPFLFVVL